MTVSKIRLNGTDHDIRAKYPIQSSSSDATSAEFSARTVTEDAIVSIQKIYGNTVVVTNNLVSNSATAILSRGFNQWDEDWESGTLVSGTGQETDNGGYIRSKNYTAIVSDGNYYFKTPSSGVGYIYFYNGDLSYPGNTFRTYFSASSTFTPPSGAKFFRLTWQGTTYNHDICINISDTAKNGTYEPYNGHQIDLNIPTLTGKLNGAGSSVVIFPDGLKKVGTVYDEIVGNKAIKRVGSVDLGTLSFTYETTYVTDTPVFYARVIGRKTGSAHLLSALYYVAGPSRPYLEGTNMAMASHNSSSSDAVDFTNSSYSNWATFTTAMTGVILYYELATPEEYILDNALQLQYPVVAGGTEMVLPTTGTAPMKMDVIYGNAADAAATMSQNFISVDSMKEFLDKLGTQMGGTWSMGYENGKHTFTFTST